MGQRSANGEALVPAHGDREGVSRAIYGLITVLAVLQAFQLHPPSPWKGAVTLVGTTLTVALIDAYADSIAETLASGRILSRDELARIGRRVLPVFVGAQGPTLALMVSALGLIDIEDAIILAQAIAFVSLFGYGWRVGKLQHEQWVRRLLSGLILVAIGGVIVGIKAAFH